MEVVKLKDIANVQVGYPFRSRLEQDKNGNVSVIQLRNVGEDGRFIPVDLSQIQMSKVEKRHLIHPNDIIFRSRGQTNKAAVVNQVPGTTIVAGPLLRIRVTSKKILPAYLNWYINHPKAQTYLAKYSKGTAVRMISKRVVEDMEVPLPPVKEQHQIIELADLSMREQQLLQELNEKRKHYMDSILIKFATGKNPNNKDIH